MDNNTILNILFKLKNKKVSSTLTKLFFEEARVNDEMLNPTRIASDISSISGTPSGSEPGLTHFHSDLLLTEDVSVSGKKSWNTNSLENFIDPSYGDGYQVRLFDDDGSGNKGNQIFPADPSDWYFFYASGQLTFFGDNSSHNAFTSNAYHIEVYQYIGNFGGSGGADTSVNVNQVTHGFITGDLIYRTSSNTYAKAFADGVDPEMADVVGVVKEVLDVDNFIYQYLIGEFINEGSGFPVGSPGDAVFLSPVTAGLMTNVNPSTLGHISKPVGIIIESDTKMILFQMRGTTVSSSGSGGDIDVSVDVNQVAHGFIVGDLIYRTSSNTYAKALADGIQVEQSDVVGVVKEIIGVDSFVYQHLIGEFINEGSGFPIGNPGDAIFLSNTVEGLMTNVPPVTLGHVSKPVGIIIESDTKMILFQMRGIAIASSEGGGTGEATYDYYVTEGDFDDLKSACADNSYLSVFVPNGIYSATVNPGTNAIEITNAKLVHGETRDGVILDMNLVENTSPTLYGIRVTSSSAVLENFTVRNFTVNKGSDIYGIYGANSKCKNVKVHDISNNHESYNGIGFRGLRGAYNIYGNNNDIDLSLVTHSSFIVARRIQGCSYLINVSMSGGSTLLNSHNITNLYMEMFTIESSYNLTNLYLSIGDDGGYGISGCYNLTNIELSMYGTMSSMNGSGIISNSQNISNFQVLDPVRSNSGDTVVVFNNCSHLSNIIIDVSWDATYEYELRIQTAITNSNYLNNVKIVGCDSYPLHNCFNINGLHIEYNHVGLTADNDILGHLQNCYNVSNVTVLAVPNSASEPEFTVNAVCFSHNLTNVKIYGSGKSGVNTGFRYGFRDCNNTTNCSSQGTSLSSFYDCNNLTNCNSESSCITITADDLSMGVFINCTNIINPKIERIHEYSITGFYNCLNVSDVNIDLSSSTGLNFLFNYCNNINNITLSYPQNVFNNSHNITNINISEGKDSVASASSNISNVTLVDCGQGLTNNFSILYGCENITNVKIIGNRETDTGDKYQAFCECDNVSNCIITGINSIATPVNLGFGSCDNISNCIVINAYNAGFYSSQKLNGCVSESNNRGLVSNSTTRGAYQQCVNVNNSSALNVGISSVGFIECSDLSSCNVGLVNDSKNAFTDGFRECKDLVNVKVYNPIGKALIDTSNVTNLTVLNSSLAGSSILIENCTNIDTVNIDSSVNNVTNIFNNCDNLSNLTVKLNPIQSILFNQCTNVNNCKLVEFYSDYCNNFRIATGSSNINGIKFIYDGSYINFTTGGGGLFSFCDNLSNIEIDIKMDYQSVPNLPGISNLDYLYVFYQSEALSNIKVVITMEQQHPGLPEFNSHYKHVNLFYRVDMLTNSTLRVYNLGVGVDEDNEFDAFFSFFRRCNKISNIGVVADNTMLDTTYDAKPDQGVEIFSLCEQISNSDILVDGNGDPTGGDITCFFSCDYITGTRLTINGVAIVASNGAETHTAANNF